MVNAIYLTVLSFGLSFFLALVFLVEPKQLVWCGIAGAITRIALIFFSSMFTFRFVYMFLAAMAAGLYAELIAIARKAPSTCFLYPAMLPLIPGDLMLNVMTAFFGSDETSLVSNCYELILALMGICFGFVFISMIVHYRRAYSLRKLAAKMLGRTLLRRRWQTYPEHQTQTETAPENVPENSADTPK